MRMIRPRLVAPQVTIAENQAEYATVTGALVKHPDFAGEANTVVLAFKPNPLERTRLAAGEAIYVSLLTFGGPMQPVLVTAGKYETAAIYGVEVEP